MNKQYDITIIYSRSMESGGALRASYISEYLSKRGHKVEFIKPMKRLPLQLDFPISLVYYTLKTLFKKCDVMIVLKSYPNTCIPAIIKKMQNTKIILDVDDLDYAYREGFMMHIGKMLQKPFPRFFDAITVHNENLRNLLTNDWNIPGNKIHDLSQGIDFELFNEKNVDKKVKERMQLEGRRIIVFTAHLDVSTDIEPIFKAFKIVCENIENCTLVIAGRGPYQKNFENMAKTMGLDSNVVFTGPFETKMLPSYIAMGDLCIVYYKDRLPNYFRTSMKLREYLAMKRPVACNDVGDLKLFRDYTYQSRTDVKDFAEKMIAGLTKGQDINFQGYEFVMKNYSWDKIIEDFENNTLNPLFTEQ